MDDKYIDKKSLGTVVHDLEKDGKLTDEEFDNLSKPLTDLEGEEEEYQDMMVESHRNIIDILKKYLDLNENYYNIIALWIMGTYFHDKFISYPYLFFNAMKGSGKSRMLNLITCLSKDGSVQNSMTEAVLFRTGGTLAIDEFEGVSKKGAENLRELLNSAYKKGVMVKRMRQKKGEEGMEQVVEEFEVYRPIVLANIWGMESVLGDRCITLVLERSNKKNIVNLMEIFREENITKKIIELLNRCRKCRCRFSGKLYLNWNNFIKSVFNEEIINTNNINHTNNINNTNYTNPFEIIRNMGLNGREVELTFPICIIAAEISDDVLKTTTLTLKNIFLDKRGDELVENTDISLYDFVSQYHTSEFTFLSEIVKQFRDHTQINDEWLNNRWMGRALKRLNLIKEKRRLGRGASMILNIEKAQEKIKIFK